MAKEQIFAGDTEGMGHEQLGIEAGGVGVGCEAGGRGGEGCTDRHPGLDPGSTFFMPLLQQGKVDAGSSPA
jgi:hypothetical protein